MVSKKINDYPLFFKNLSLIFIKKLKKILGKIDKYPIISIDETSIDTHINSLKDDHPKI